jgi:hypothetical protein
VQPPKKFLVPVGRRYSYDAASVSRAAAEVFRRHWNSRSVRVAGVNGAPHPHRDAIASAESSLDRSWIMVISAFNVIDQRDVVNLIGRFGTGKLALELAGHEPALVGRATSLRETTAKSPFGPVGASVRAKFDN